MRSIFHRMDQCNHKLDMHTKVCLTLAWLPMEFSNFEFLYKSKVSSGDRSMDNLIMELSNFELKLTHNKLPPAAEPSANAFIAKYKCDNCGKEGHTKSHCFSKGGGKEGQAPWQRKKKDKANVAMSETTSTGEQSFALHSGTSRVTESDWVLDSGATNHWTPHRHLFQTFEVIRSSVSTANGVSVDVVGKGEIPIYVKTVCGQMIKVLVTAFYVPSFSCNLLSTSMLLKKKIST